jgi:hypothetical protein
MKAGTYSIGLHYRRILEGLNIIMGNNVFSFGNTFFKKANGTASMCTTCACSYASIYYSFPEGTAHTLFYQNQEQNTFKAFALKFLQLLRA